MIYYNMILFNMRLYIDYNYNVIQYHLIYLLFFPTYFIDYFLFFLQTFSNSKKS